MKKKLSYRDKLLELAYIYNVREIKDYIKSRKNLTTGQLELILKKNSITIPKDFKTNFVKENIYKPISRIKNSVIEFKDDQIKAKNRFIRKTENYRHDTKRKISGSLKNLWNSLGVIGLNFLNIIPKLGQTIYKFFADVLTDLFNGIYNQQISPKNAKTAIIGFFVIIGVSTIIIAGVTNFNDVEQTQKTEIKEPKIKEKIIKEQVKKNEKKSKAKV
ncbi:hypothetical protein OAN49_01080, partial [Pelagibacteraceae bacterium]|nr:hypothetical protein [Pelagibacteraceae bacterium]